MRRRLSNVATAVSLVLCVATAALWVRSYVVADGLKWQSRPDASSAANSLFVTSDRGGVVAWQMWESIAESQDGFFWTRGAPGGYLRYADWKFRRVGSRGRLLGFGYFKD